MSFRNLQERIELLGQTEKFQEIYEEIKKIDNGEYATTLAYFLSVINDLSMNAVDDFAIIGGYASLLHLVQTKSERVLVEWRGSRDLDLASRTETVESIMRGQYERFTRKPSHFDRRKIDVEIGDAELSSTCKVDLYLAFKDQPIHLQAYSIGNDFWSRVENANIFGINVPVASKTDLLQMKLAVNTPSDGLPRRHDRYDILNLIAMLERTQSPQELWKELPLYAKQMLQKILKMKAYDTHSKIEDLGLDICPSSTYLRDLRTLAKNLRG